MTYNARLIRIKSIPRPMKKSIAILVFCSLFLLSACSWMSDDADPYHGMSADQMFNAGQEALDSGYYSNAAKAFEALITDYPFGKIAQRASLDLIYAYYMADDLPASTAAADSFMHLYPRSKQVDYAYYMKGVANFSQDRGMMLRYFPSNYAERDPGSMIESYDNFNELVARFPHSEYAPDARQRMIYLRNLFAEREYLSADFYFEHGAYVAAANRASFIVRHYQQAPVVEDSLKLMIKSYRKLEVTDAANEAEKILQMNFKG